MRWIIVLLLQAVILLPAHAVVTAYPTLARNPPESDAEFANKRHTAYPNANAPITPTPACSVFTCDTKGDSSGVGTITESDSGATLRINAGGDTDGSSSRATDVTYAYVPVVSGNYQVTGKLPAVSATEWAGNQEPFTGFAVYFTVDGTDTAYQTECGRFFNGTNFFKYGTPGTSISQQNGAIGTALPLWYGASYEENVEGANDRASCFRSDDGSNWVVVYQLVAELNWSNWRAGWAGWSHLAGATTSATISEITRSATITLPVGSEPDPDPAPTCDPISTQNWAQGVAVSLQVTCTGATSYSATGLLGGVSINTSTGLISGTPTATAVSNSPLSVIATGSNGSGSTNVPFTANVTGVPGSGNTFLIPASQSTINCQSSQPLQGGDNAVPQPGDRFIVSTRTSTLAVRCDGTAAAPYRFTGNPALSARTSWSTSNSSPALDLDGSTHLLIDGSDLYVGANGYCGTEENSITGLAKDNVCGIEITRTSGSPFRLISMGGNAENITIQWVECDGTWPGGSSTTGAGVCTQPNDNDYRGTDLRKRNLKILNSYIHHFRNECLYFGHNYEAPVGSGITNISRLEDAELAYLWVHTCAWDGIEMKSAWWGVSSIHHNWVENVTRPAGISGGANLRGISCYECVRVDIHDNVVIDAGGTGISHQTDVMPQAAAGGVDAESHIYNNIVIGAGTPGWSQGYGIAPNTNTTSKSIKSFIRNNLVLDAANNEINVGGANQLAAGRVTCNITDGTINDGPYTQQLNITTAVAGWFNNPGARDYRLVTGNSSIDACSGVSGTPSTSITGTARPQGAASDRGPHERAP